MGTPSAGDIDGDGSLEVVVASMADKVHVLGADGTPFGLFWPALGDLDGDGAMEVVVYTSGHLIYAWHTWDLDLDGVADVVPGWPINMGGAGASPAIVDLDGDGDVEVASGSVDSMMFFWDCAGPYDPLTTGWGQFHHDPMRTGFHP